jgi:hypothetical protein
MALKESIAMIKRNIGMERALLKKFKPTNDRFATAMEAHNIISSSKYVEGIAVVRYRDVLPVQYIQFEHAWCVDEDGLVVDFNWHDYVEGHVCYILCHAIAEPLVNVANHSFKQPYTLYLGYNSNKHYHKLYSQAKRLAVEAFIEYDRLNGEINLWQSKAVMKRKK